MLIRGKDNGNRVLIAALLACLVALWWQSNAKARVEQDLQNARETKATVVLADGTVGAAQEVLQQKDLDRLAAKMFKHLDALSSELKQSHVDAVTSIRLALPSNTEVTVEDDQRTAWVRDDWFTVQISLPEFEIVSSEHAPIELDIVESNNEGVRSMFAVARNGWTGAQVNQIEVQRVIVQADVFDPYFSIGAGIFNTSPFVEVTRHTTDRGSWSGMLGYDVQDKGLSFGVSRRYAIRWNW